MPSLKQFEQNGEFSKSGTSRPQSMHLILDGKSASKMTSFVFVMIFIIFDIILIKKFVYLLISLKNKVFEKGETLNGV